MPSIHQWATSTSGAETTNPLEKTHAFLTEERGGYPEGKKSSDRRVHVAVLDTGVDLATFSESEKRRVSTYCTIPTKEDQGGNASDKHGTDVVRIVLDVAPEVNISTYRVFEDTRNIAPDWVASAIKMAIDAQVDIIIMSFGFDDVVPDIRDAVTMAISKDILIFAASSNDGSQPQIPIKWPARHTGVFCILAADDYGAPYRRNPSVDGLKTRLASFGVDITPSRSRSDGTVSLTGTSYATAIAAATAALFIDFAQLCMQEMEDEMDEATSFTHMKYVRQYDSMEALLLASGVPHHGLDYIKPWSIFEFQGWDKKEVASMLGIILKKVHGIHPQ